MSQQRGGQEPQPCYMDGICVKISEKYKPPPRINLAITYAQRLSLNSQIRDNIIPYDFSLEENIKERAKELKNVRKLVQDEKRERLEKIKRAKKKYEDSKAATKEISDKETELYNVSSELKDLETAHYNPTQILSNPIIGNSDVLYPSSYSHILTPTPMVNVCEAQTFACQANDKSPFNIAEFEADTSSPFDNMELKTINDIEELAQVLKKDESYSAPPPYTISQTYSNYAPLPSIPTTHSSYGRQEALTANPQYVTYTLPQSSVMSVSSYTQPTLSTPYNNIKDYYYTPEMLPAVNQRFSPYAYNNIKLDNPSENLSPQANMVESKKSTFRSVPDIMKALETELDNTHIYKVNDSPSIPKNNHHKQKVIPRKAPETTTVNCELEDPYILLPKNLQDLSKNISSMGFPISRVARVCQTLGNDYKKIVEHLLVMSELLDLGFSEQAVSRALLQCNNDRDKALDILIS